MISLPAQACASHLSSKNRQGLCAGGKPVEISCLLVAVDSLGGTAHLLTLSGIALDDLSNRRSNKNMNVELYKVLGWMFVALTAIFALGIAGPLARQYYPGPSTLPRRLAAPLIFNILAMACFMGFGQAALIFTVLLGLTLVVSRRWRLRNDKPAA